MNNRFSQILKSYSAELALLKPLSEDGEGAKQKRRLKVALGVTAGSVVLVFSAGVFWGGRAELVVMASIVAGLLFYLYRIQNQFLRQQEDYQTRLHTMAAAIEERNRELKQLVMIDPLTEVMNRRGFERVLKTETNRARRNNYRNFALLIDCDDFKGINEKYGHSVGDIVLQELSSRLVKAVRPSDFVARVGGDEFIILLTEADESTAMQVAQRVRLAVAETPIKLTGGTTTVTTSTGVTALPPELVSIEEILAAANAGLKTSKRSGKNSVSFSNLSEEKNEMISLLERIRSGESLHVVYQPIAQLENQHVVAYELECRGPRGVFEHADAMLNLAREHNFKTALELRCLKLCLEQASHLPDMSPCHIKLSPSALIDIPAEDIEEFFESRGRRVCVTLSDNEFAVDPNVLKPHVDALKDARVEVAIDNVGSGFCSLECLFLLEVNFVKLNRDFVKTCLEDEAKRRLLRRIVKLAESIDCKVIADGIQSQDHLMLMRDCGVQYGQGVFWGLPVGISAPEQPDGD